METIIRGEFNTDPDTINTEKHIQLFIDYYMPKQNTYHSQGDFSDELDRLIKYGHLERLETIEEDCFVSPVVITVKKDKTVKIALDARKLNESCVKKRPHLSKKEELPNQISAELSKNDYDPI